MKTLLYCMLSIYFFIVNIPTLIAEGKEPFSFTASDYYQKFVSSMQSENYKWAEYYGTTLLSAYPKSQFSKDIYFLLGKIYFTEKKLDLANSFFSKYLQEEGIAKNLREVFAYKLQIAQQFEKGTKKALFPSKLAPNWLSGREESLQICEEIIMSLPKDDLAAEALFCKSKNLLAKKKFQESIQALEKLIERFPKHSLALEAYIQIGRVYLLQTTKQFPDPDHLELAKINLKKMQYHFPEHPKIKDLVELVDKMESTFAERLFVVAQHYENMNKPSSAAIYYETIIQEYPNTKHAKTSQYFINSRKK